MLIIFFGILLSLLTIYYIFFGQHTVNCSSFSNEFYEWFPYSKGDKLIFTNNNLNKTFIVLDYQSNHTKSYQSNQKCGCCEDNINVTLANENDTLKIDFQNIDYEKSCLGSSIEINGTFVDLDGNQIDSMNNQKKIKIGEYLIEKKKGISEFNLSEKTWKFQKIMKSNSKNELISNNCN